MLDCVKHEIKSKIHSESNPDGFLGSGEEVYLQCIELKSGELDHQFSLDEEFLRESIRQSDLEAGKIQKQMKDLIVKHRLELSTFLRENIKKPEHESLLVLKKPLRFSFRRLPMWGRPIREDEIKFEWPTQEILNNLPADATLARLEFSTFDKSAVEISSVKCHLSNRLESRVFKGKRVESLKHKVIKFDPKRRVRFVQAKAKGKINRAYVRRITFIDGMGQEIDSYNPSDEQRSGAIHEVKENESLIGVYGAKEENEDFFSTFGFIVKVSHY